MQQIDKDHIRQLIELIFDKLPNNMDSPLYNDISLINRPDDGKIVVFMLNGKNLIIEVKTED